MFWFQEKNIFGTGVAKIIFNRSFIKNLILKFKRQDGYPN
jgi:hypothetical protein